MGSGKTTLSGELYTALGYPVISFGGIIAGYFARQTGGQPDRYIIQEFGVQLIEKFGGKGKFKWLMEHSVSVDWNKPLIIDGFRSLGVFRHCRDLFRTTLIMCFCALDLRVGRIMIRDGITRAEVDQIISHSSESGVEEFSTEADFIYTSDNGVEEIIKKIQELNI